MRWGLFQPSRPQRLWWGYKDSDLHRLARPRPWWENAAIFMGLLAFIQLSSLAFYFFNRLYHSYKPSGNDILVISRIDALVFSRPDLAVAAVRMAIHHFLSGTTSPFGDPIVAPEYLRPEAEALFDCVLQLHAEQPTYSIPDLWALTTAKALARLGGPLIPTRRGRPDPTEEDGTLKVPSKLLIFKPSLIREDVRDVLKMKRMLSKQGFSLQEMVALIGGVRTIGFHESSGVHTTEEVKPTMRRLSTDSSPTEETIKTPVTRLKCTMDPYVFGGEYFDLLLDFNWKRPFFSRRGPFYSSETDRKREVVLLDPFSEEAVDRERKKLRARERANEAMERAAKKHEAMLAMKESGEADESGTAVSASGWGIGRSFFGRTGEAQTIPGVKIDDQGNLLSDDSLDAKDGRLEGYTDDGDDDYVVTGMTVESPCPQISMREMDVMLLDDALCVGWLYKFSANEVQFYTVFGEILTKAQNFGYNINELFLPQR